MHGKKNQQAKIGYRAAQRPTNQINHTTKHNITTQHPNTPPHPTKHHQTTVFFYNLLLKLSAWRLFLVYERGLKRRARREQQQQQQQQRQPKRKVSKPTPSWGILGGGNGSFDRRGSWGAPLGAKQVSFLRRLRRGVVWYYALSDLVLIGAMAVHYWWWGEGQELLRHQQMAEHDPHRYDELERRVVAFNWCVGVGG